MKGKLQSSQSFWITVKRENDSKRCTPASCIHVIICAISRRGFAGCFDIQAGASYCCQVPKSFQVTILAPFKSASGSPLIVIAILLGGFAYHFITIIYLGACYMH